MCLSVCVSVCDVLVLWLKESSWLFVVMITAVNSYMYFVLTGVQIHLQVGRP